MQNKQESTSSNNDNSSSSSGISSISNNSSPHKLIQVLSLISDGFFLTTCAACISLFSKIVSTVVVISQLGSFMGVAVVLFYLQFHLIIIPLWIFTSRYPIPIIYKHKLAELVSSITNECYVKFMNLISRNQRHVGCTNGINEDHTIHFEQIHLQDNSLLAAQVIH